MLIQEVTKKTDKKARVVLEDGTSFVLYVSEIRKLQIHPQEDLSDEKLHVIMDEILTRRSRMRCMNLLKTSDRTVDQLRSTLVRDGYPEEIVRQALAYVASYHYTDDTRYAQNYIRQMSGRKSRKQMEYDLMKRGVDRDTVRAAFSEADEEAAGEDPEILAIRALMKKRGFDPGTADRAQYEKMMRYLQGKGFGYSSIRSAFSNSEY